MFQNFKRSHVVVGGLAGLTLLVSTAAVAGVLPRPVATEQVSSVHAAPANLNAASDPATTAGTTATTAAPADSTTVAPDTTTAVVPSTTATTKTTVKAPAITAPPATDPVTVPATTAPTTPPVTTPAKAARANPTDAQVTTAMQQLHAQIPLLPVNVAYGRQFGDAVCSAFDQGNAYSQVKTLVGQAVSQIPMLKISSAQTDFAIRTAVQLFCPGYTPQLP